jgi:hypothetical protein
VPAYEWISYALCAIYGVDERSHGSDPAWIPNVPAGC